jgi:hypothetical protein
MKRRVAIVAGITAIITPVISLTWGTPVAWAINCTDTKSVLASYQWTRSGNDVDGVRAPIQMRLDGGLCANYNNCEQNSGETMKYYDTRNSQ